MFRKIFIVLFLSVWFSALPIFADSTTVAVTDSNVVKGLSPLAWVKKTGYICASVANASIKVGFTGTSRVALNVDTKAIATTVAARYPIISWSVNGGTFQTHQLANGESSVVLANGVANPVIDLYCKGFSPFENRYAGDVPVNAVKITGFTLDAGGKTAAAIVPPKIWLNIGNSIESGDAALYAANQGRPPDDNWAASDDARASYGFLLATHYNFREVRMATGGYDWSGGLAGMPRLASLVDSITSTTSRLTNGKLIPCPDVVLINLGENGAPASIDVTDALTKLRNRTSAATRIIVMIPASGKARAEVTAAYNTYKTSSNDSKVFIVDLGTITFATADGTHPTVAGHQTIFAAALPFVDNIVLANADTIPTSPFNIANSLAPYWNCDTMYNESVLMTSADGVASPQASLQYSPLSIVSVRDATLRTVYAAGVDYSSQGNILSLLPGSKAAYLTNAQLYPAIAGNKTQPKNGGGYVLWSEGHYIQHYQLSVTYTHAQGGWSGPVPHYQKDSLPATTTKLKNGNALKILYFGDSILEGFSASGYLCQDATTVSPYMPSWGQLITDDLKRYYTSSITARNAAVAGQTSAWGVSNVHSLVTVENPDLVVVAFGMNDGGSNVSTATFKANIQAIISDVRASNPSAEFILVSPTLANSETGFAGIQAQYNAVLQQLTGVGTVLVNMTGVHQELLKHKAFRDMTGNNINHPDDFLTRWYAQQVLGMLVPDTMAASVTRTNVALASFGGHATASSTMNNNYYPYTMNNGDRRGYDWNVGRNGGGWNDSMSGVYPDWAQIQFNSSKTINEIDVFTVQDSYQTPVEPTSAMTFSQYGITDFTVQYWSGSAWTTVTGGAVTGNNKVWRQFTFTPITTDKIRVNVTAALNGYSRIMEIEAYGSDPVSVRFPHETESLQQGQSIGISTRRIHKGIAIRVNCPAIPNVLDMRKIRVDVFDADGKVMPGVRPVESGSNAVLYFWDPGRIPSGVYFVKARLGNLETIRRLNVILGKD